MSGYGNAQQFYLLSLSKAQWACNQDVVVTELYFSLTLPLNFYDLRSLDQGQSFRLKAGEPERGPSVLTNMQPYTSNLTTSL